MAKDQHTGDKIPEEKLALFVAAYLENDFNATKAAMTIGMSKRTAQANAYRYTAAMRKRLDVLPTLDAAGFSVDGIVKDLAIVRDSLVPKWNVEKGKWDYFRDGRLMLDAIEKAIKLRNMYPGEPARQDPVIVNVTINAAEL